MYKKNIGSVDGYIRFLIGVSLVINALIFNSATVTTVALLVFGTIVLATCYSGYCLLYSFFNIGTVGRYELDKSNYIEEKRTIFR